MGLNDGELAMQLCSALRHSINGTVCINPIKAYHTQCDGHISFIYLQMTHALIYICMDS